MTVPKKSLNIEDYRAGKVKRAIKERFFGELEKIHERNQCADTRFLTAWKQGIKLVGAQYSIFCH